MIPSPSGNKDLMEPFQKHLNSLQDLVKFIIETETKGQLSFLDVLAKRKGNKLTTSIFRKRIHTDQYLHYSSHHHCQLETGIISCLRHMANNLCNDTEARDEIFHLQQTFEANGYPPQIVHKVLHDLSQFPVPSMDENEKPRLSEHSGH